jgi:hypothetical protein
MNDGICAVAADTKLETPEGPLTMRTIAKTPCSVMTRTEDGKTRFHMIVSPEQLEAPQPVLRVQLDNGLALRVGADQVLFREGMREVRAADLEAGDQLVSVFAFPTGYAYRADDGTEQTSRGTVTVQSVAPAGEADVFRFRVNVTGRFAFSAGVLGKADPA